MEPDFTAKTPEELSKIGRALFKAKKQKNLDEQIQMTRLLEQLWANVVFEFPLRVYYTGETSVPDFQIDSDGKRIAIELAKLAKQDVEHARGLQATWLRRTLCISSLYRDQVKSRTRDQVIDEGFMLSQVPDLVSVEEMSQIWSKRVIAELNDKTDVLTSDRFKHGHEDWLVLWDRIGICDGQENASIQSLSDLLAPLWLPDWYSTVFLQEEYFQWSVMFTPHGHIVLDSRRDV